jgi:hypothetical protein
MPRTKIAYPKDLEKDLDEYLPNASASTKKTYMTNLTSLANYLDAPLSVSMFSDFDEIKKDLEGLKYTTNTLKNKLSSIVTYLKMYDAKAELVSKYSDYIDSLSGKLSRKNETMDKTDKEKENWMTKKELEDYADKLKSELPPKPTSYSDMLKWMKYITLRTHILYPLRNELSDAKIVPSIKTNDPEANYVILDKKNDAAKILLQVFKTAKTYKSIDIKVLPALAKEMNTFYKHLVAYKKNNGIDNDWMLLNKKGEKFSRNDYTYFVQSIFEPLGKKISTTLIRKIIVSDLYNPNAMKELARVMAHDPKTAMTYYAKD